MLAPRPSPTGEPPEAGYTLIELLVVLAIAGGLLAMAPALLGAAKGATEDKAVARSLANDLRKARAAAITSGGETGVLVDLEQGTYQLIPKGGARNLPHGLAASFRGPSGNLTGNQARIAFFADGSSSGGQITLRRGSRATTVSAHWLTGRVSVDD